MSTAQNTPSHRPTPAQTILVIEDDAPLLDMLCEVLSDAGYVPLPATSGVAGLALLEHQGANLILLDLHLPDIDGWTLASRIHDRATGSPPILVLTATDREQGVVTSLHLGADDYLTKPFVIDELLARVEALLRRTRSPSE